jgi:hypothetical protein
VFLFSSVPGNMPRYDHGVLFDKKIIQAA